MAPSNQMSVLSPLFLGVATTFCTIIIHGLVFGMIIAQVRRDLLIGRAGVGFWRDLTIVAGATLLALTAHIVEIGLWALVFDLCGEFLNFDASF
jgi:hypothetical protein